MTIADRKTSSGRRSWLTHLRAAPPSPITSSPASPVTSPNNPAQPDAWSPLHKPHGDMADLLIMSTVDQKAPPTLSGGADLLNALVQEHLERAPPAQREEIPPVPVPTIRNLSEAERAAILQREIEILLQESPPERSPASAPESPEAPHPVAEAPAAMDASAPLPTPPVALPVTAEMVVPPAEPVTLPDAEVPTTPGEKLSREELDILLARESGTVVAEAAAPVVSDAGNPGASFVGESEAEQQLSEAEGVLADELAKLMEETTSPGEASPGANAATPAAPVQAADALLSEGSSKLMAAPGSESLEPLAGTPRAGAPAAVAQEPVAAAAAEPALEVAPPAPANAVAAERPAGVPAEPIVELARPGLLERGHTVLAGLMLTAAQLLDLPFGWLDDLSKNVIGMAAFLLLAGGAVLWVLSHFVALGGG